MWPLTVAALIAKLVSRSPARLIVSDHAALSKQYAGRGYLHRQFLKWSMRLVYPKAFARVVVAANAAKDISNVSGLPEESFEAIYNPVEYPHHGQVDADSEKMWAAPAVVSSMSAG